MKLLSDREKFQEGFVEEIPATPRDKYVSIVVLRETKSHTVFTTEGSNLDVEKVQRGYNDSEFIDRILMYKRKQIAPERRKGKALLREHDALEEDCYLMEGMCTECPDCILYGYAAGGADSQESRILTDSGFTIRSFEELEENIKFNAIEDSTKGGVAGSAFNSRSHLMPEVYLPTVETLVDVTVNEFIYVLGNILRTTRYGAESNRQGTIKNHIVDIIFSDAEFTSNLELSQRMYDYYRENKEEDLNLNAARDYLVEALDSLQEEVYTPLYSLREEGEVEPILTKLQEIYSQKDKTRDFLEDLKADVNYYIEKTR